MNDQIYQAEYSTLLSILDVGAVFLIILSLYQAFWNDIKYQCGDARYKYRKVFNILVVILCFGYLLIPNDVFRKYEVGDYRLVKVYKSTFIVQQLTKVPVDPKELKDKGINIVEDREYNREEWRNSFTSKDSLKAINYVNQSKEAILKKKSVDSKNKIDSLKSVKVYEL
jgi:hypothetical protein